MGRPKKSDLQCNICSKTFLRKINLEEHMKCHSGSAKKSIQVKTQSNWCPICKKSFEDSEYKAHLRAEHKFGFQNQSTSGESSKSDGDLYSCENGYVLLSKRRIKKEADSQSSACSEVSPKKKVSNFQTYKDFDVALRNIKIEPIEIFEPPKMDETLKRIKNRTFIKCYKCGVRCKGQKGLKIHNSIAHRESSSDSSESDSESEEENENQHQGRAQSKTSCNQGNDGNPVLLPNNSFVNLNPNAQSGIFYNVLPLDNTLTVGNQPNVLPPACNQSAKILEIIPKFDCESEDYTTWLKKFIYKCRNQEYPLPLIMCENINHVLDEIACAIGNPVGPLRKKSNYFYFMKMHKTLSEVMLGHMRYSLSSEAK